MLRKYRRSGSFPFERLEMVLVLLQEGATLPANVRDHALKGALVAFRELHLGFDMLMQYRLIPEEECVVIVAIGTHRDVFGG